MNINQLQYLDKLVKYKSISKASAECFLTQSALTRQLLLMEKELGFTIFKRSKNGIELTEEGAIFYNETRKTVQSYQSALDRVNQFKSRHKKEIRVSISNYLTDTILYACKSVESKLTNFSFSFVRERLMDTAESLLQGRLDLVLLTDYSEDRDDLIFEPLFYCYNAVKVPNSHALAQWDKITLQQLRNETVLVSSHIHGRSNILYINRLLKNPQLQINVIEFASIEEADAKNVIYSVPLSTLSCFDQGSNFKLIPIEDAHKVKIGLLYRKEDAEALALPCAAFKDYFKGVIKNNPLITALDQ